MSKKKNRLKSSRPEVICKKVFSKIHNKTPVPEFLSSKFIRKDNLAQVFSWLLWNFYKQLFSWNSSGGWFCKLLLLICFRSNCQDVFLGKGVLKRFIKFTVEYPCWSVISIKLLPNFFQITFPHGFSPVNLLHFLRILFYKNTYGGLLLMLLIMWMLY